jgi:hypothetical protein
MMRYTAPLLIAATMYFMTLPAPALAHGLSSVAATFILLFLGLAVVAPTLTDFLTNQAVALQRPRQARSHPRQSHRSRCRTSFVLGVAVAE